MREEAKVQHELFRLGMYWRIAYGVLRLIFGLALLELVNVPVVSLLDGLMEHQLRMSPDDVTVRLVNSFLGDHPFVVTNFLAFYFIFWGFVDVFMSWMLLKERYWAFPVSMALVGVFLVYEVFRFTHTHSLVLLWVIFVDIAILYLINKEYGRVRRREVMKRG